MSGNWESRSTSEDYPEVTSASEDYPEVTSAFVLYVTTEWRKEEIDINWLTRQVAPPCCDVRVAIKSWKNHNRRRLVARKGVWQVFKNA